MSSRGLAVSGVLAILMASSAISDAYSATAPSHPKAAREDRHAGFRLPRELKIIWKKEEHARLKAMPKDQRKGWLKTQWASMSDQQRHVKLAELQKKWDSLPQSVRQRLLERKQEKHEAHRMQREPGGTSSRAASGQTQPR